MLFYLQRTPLGPDEAAETLKKGKDLGKGAATEGPSCHRGVMNHTPHPELWSYPGSPKTGGAKGDGDGGKAGLPKCLCAPCLWREPRGMAQEQKVMV